jgi:rhodanese-related sulfurtransferase
LSARSIKEVAMRTMSSGLFDPGIQHSNLLNARAMLGRGAIAIDVREPEEFAAGSLPGARNVPLSRIEREGDAALAAAGVQPDQSEYLILCRAGARSRSACARLHSVLGKRAHNLDGGIIAWAGAGLPIVIPERHHGS